MGFNLRGTSAAVLFLTFGSVLSAAPRLGLSTTTIGTINIIPGSNGANQTVQAFNLGTGTLNPTATGSASWLAPTVGASAACSQPGGTCYPVNIALNTAALAAGTYTEYVTVSDPNAVDSPQYIAVTINTTGVPSSINAYVTPQGGITSNAIFPVYTTGTGVKATVTTQTGGPWLQFLSGASGLINYPYPWFIEVAAQVGQAPGTYTGTVVISGSSAASDNKTINVTLNVTNSPIVELNNSSTIQLTSNVGGASQYSVVTFNNLGAGSLNITSATGSAAFLTASVTSPNSILITANPTGLSAGLASGAITISSNAVNNAQVSVPVELLVLPAGQPLIGVGGIVNAATGAQEAVSQGDIAAIYGAQLAPAGTAATNPSTPLATTLGTVQVLVNGTPAPLYYVSPGQINFQVPYGASTSQLSAVQVVSNGMAGNTRSLSVNAGAPRLLGGLGTFIAGNYGVIVNNSDGSLTLPTGTVVGSFKTHPAKPGDVITIYCIGFGQTSPVAVEGQAAPSSPLDMITGVTATFGGGFSGRATNATPSFTGLTPTAVGLYQINVTIPSDVPLGPAVPVSVVVNGIQSNNVTLAVSASGK